MRARCIDVGNGRDSAARRAATAIGGFAGDRSATSAVEFSILAFPFVLLLFAILGTGLAFVGELTLDKAVVAMGRRIGTGQASKSGMTAAAFRQAICDATYGLFTCANLKIDVRSYARYSDLPGGPPLAGSGHQKTLDTSGFGFQAGTANTIMAVQVYYEWNVFISPLQGYFSDLQSGSYLVGSVSAFKTEPFDAN
jgi:Flp pilus assembly protein TadG